jgi:hypothetical protein
LGTSWDECLQIEHSPLATALEPSSGVTDGSVTAMPALGAFPVIVTAAVVWVSARPLHGVDLRALGTRRWFGKSFWPPAADVDLSGMATTHVEIDTDLLARLRERHPGKDDRSLIEDMARIELGFAAVRDAQKRNALTEEEAIELGVQAVHEARRASA